MSRPARSQPLNQIASEPFVVPNGRSISEAFKKVRGAARQVGPEPPAWLALAYGALCRLR